MLKKQRSNRGNPHAGFLRRKLRHLGIAYLIGAALALGGGHLVSQSRKGEEARDFSARGLVAPEDLLRAFQSREPEELERAIRAHPHEHEALALLIDRRHGFKGLSGPDREELLQLAAPHLPIDPLKNDFEKIFHQSEHGFHLHNLAEKKTALKFLEAHSDPAARKLIEMGKSWTFGR